MFSRAGAEALNPCKIEEILGIDSQEAALVSAKTGDGIKDLLEKIIKKLPSPSGNESNPLKCMLEDSWYDCYLGVVVLYIDSFLVLFLIMVFYSLFLNFYLMFLFW